jgi:Fe2+ transport system protein FeoA
MMLAELGPGQRFEVLRIVFGGEIGKRLADLGFISGTEGEVVRAALFRGPMQIRLGDYDLIMRRHEARLVEVNPLPQAAASTSESDVHMPLPLRPHIRSHFAHGARDIRHIHRAFGKKSHSCH